MFNSSEILTSSGIEAMSAAYQSIQNPQEKGTFSAALVCGASCAFDAAAQYGMDKLPPGPVTDFASAAVSNLDLVKAPGAIQNIIDGGLSGGLSAAVNDIASGIDFNNVNVASLRNQLTSGNFGDVAGLFQNFANQPSLNSLVPGLPTTASSLLGAAGLGGPWVAAIPAAGLGIQAATALLGGQNPMGAILGGVRSRKRVAPPPPTSPAAATFACCPSRRRRSPPLGLSCATRRRLLPPARRSGRASSRTFSAAAYRGLAWQRRPSTCRWSTASTPSRAMG